VTGVASSKSVMAVDTGVLSVASLSKVPPLTSVMAAATGAWPLTKSLGAVTFTVPVVWPGSMVMVLPLDSVTTNGVPATGVSTVAVYVIGWPSTADAGAVSVTVVGSLTSVDTGAVPGTSSSKVPPVTLAMPLVSKRSAAGR
jgi:hypothetical protein